MITYRYECDACNKQVNKDFRMGKAPPKVRCSCGSVANRFYTIPTVKITNPVSKARVGRGRG
jgi:hypothetical protein